MLIIDGNEAMQKLRGPRAEKLRSSLHMAKSVVEAALLWASDFFDFVLLEVAPDIQGSNGVPGK